MKYEIAFNNRDRKPSKFAYCYEHEIEFKIGMELDTMVSSLEDYKVDYEDAFFLTIESDYLTLEQVIEEFNNYPELML